MQNKTADGQVYMLKDVPLEGVEFAVVCLSGLAHSPTLHIPYSQKQQEVCSLTTHLRCQKEEFRAGRITWKFKGSKCWQLESL